MKQDRDRAKQPRGAGGGPVWDGNYIFGRDNPVRVLDSARLADIPLPLPRGRCQIEATPDVLRVTVPPARDWQHLATLIGGLLIWVLAGTFTGVHLLREILDMVQHVPPAPSPADPGKADPGPVYFALCLIVWVFAGGALAWTLAMDRVGVETLAFTASGLECIHTVYRWSHVKCYDLYEFENPRITFRLQPLFGNQRTNHLALGRGAGAPIILRGVDPAEIEGVFAVVTRHFPTWAEQLRRRPPSGCFPEARVAQDAGNEKSNT